MAKMRPRAGERSEALESFYPYGNICEDDSYPGMWVKAGSNPQPIDKKET